MPLRSLNGSIRSGSVGLLIAFALCGCESPGWAARLHEIFSASPDARTTPAEEERHRVEYIESRSHDSIQWLLRHRIENGMSHDAVSKALGEQGMRESRDGWLKAGAGTAVQLGDDVYGFGPDDHGRTYYLVFRDDALVGFDPKDYGDARPRKKATDDGGSDGSNGPSRKSR